MKRPSLFLLSSFIFGTTPLLLATAIERSSLLPKQSASASSNEQAHEHECTRQNEDSGGRNADMDPSLVDRSFEPAHIQEAAGAESSSDFRDVENENGDEAAGSWSGHDIKAIAPNIDNMSHVIGVPPQLVYNWVFAGFRNDLARQNNTWRQIVQIIEKRKESPMTNDDINHLRSDLANRALEAQGRPAPLANEEPRSTKLAGESTAEEIKQFAAGAGREPEAITPRTMVAELLQQAGVGHHVSDFLIENVAKEKTACQESYKIALKELNDLSSEIAAALAAEKKFPTTEKERDLFRRKYDELIMQAATAGQPMNFLQQNDGALEQCEKKLNCALNKAYGCKTALYILEVANEHRNKFLTALQTTQDPRRYQVYCQNIEKLNQTINQLKESAKEVLATVSLLDSNSHLPYFFHRHAFIARAISKGENYKKSSDFLFLHGEKLHQRGLIDNSHNPNHPHAVASGQTIRHPLVLEGLRLKEAASNARRAEIATDPVAKRHHELARDAGIAAAEAYRTNDYNTGDRLSSDRTYFNNIAKNLELRK